MPKFEVKGLDAVIKQFQHIDTKTTGIVKMALYDGAAVVANEIRTGMEASLSEASWNEERRTGDLERSLYISPMQTKDGFTYTEIGFAGYGADGRPNAIKAAVLNNGRSGQARTGTKFIQKAVNRAKKPCVAAMQSQFEKQLEKITKEN